MSDIQLLAITQAVVTLSKALLQEGALPKKALDDSLHIAIAAVHDVDYLLTWNCRHIANGRVMRKLAQLNLSLEIMMPVICTPEELLEYKE